MTGFTPSALRTLVLGTYLGLAPRGRQAACAPLRWPNKAAGETLDYSLDLTAPLADMGGDTIVAGAVIPAITPAFTGGLNIVSQTVSGALVTFLLSQGVPNEDFTVNIMIPLASGRVLQPVVALFCSPAVVPLALPILPAVETADLTNAAGEVITDANGNPINTVT